MKNIPLPKCDVWDMATSTLAHNHSAIDSAIEGRGEHRLDDNFQPAVAKKLKLAMREELMRRAARDELAAKYVAKRDWSTG